MRLATSKATTLNDVDLVLLVSIAVAAGLEKARVTDGIREYERPKLSLASSVFRQYNSVHADWLNYTLCGW